MITAPSPTSVALLLGLSFFLGLAFEEFFAHTDVRRPGGIRTFPLLALAGGALYLFDPVHFLPFTAGLLVLGAWLFVYYGAHVSEHEKQADDDGNSDINVGLVVPVLNVLAYVLGAAALALPPWVAVTITVAAVLLLTGRERLHALARRIEIKEIVTAGLLVLGAWLFVYYGAHVSEHEKHAADDDNSDINVGLVIPVLNVLAYVLGAAALALPPWVAVTITVAAVLLLTGREQLHALARRVEIKEIVTAGEFLILTGIVLPLLPNHAVTTLTAITPRQVWLALVVVCSFSYASYLAQRYWAAAAGGLWMAALGGMYSSTATTVVLARQAKADPALKRQAQDGITLATAIMYLRILAVVAIFNFGLARVLALPLCALSLAGFATCALQYWLGKPAPVAPNPAAVQLTTSANPLELGAAAVFAALFVAVSIVSAVAKSQFGISGIYGLAGIVGVTDIDPFVLNLAQGGVAGVPEAQLAAAILIAASSNNVLKAVYAASFGGSKATAGSAAALILLAVAGVAIAIAMAMWPL